MNTKFENINREETLQVAQVVEGCMWFKNNCYEQNQLNTEGNVVQSSLFIDDEIDTVVKITKQFPIDFYINQKGNCVKTKAPIVDPFSITVYNTSDQLKTIYRVIEVEKDVPFDDRELE